MRESFNLDESKETSNEREIFQQLSQDGNVTHSQVVDLNKQHTKIAIERSRIYVQTQPASSLKTNIPNSPI